MLPNITVLRWWVLLCRKNRAEWAKNTCGSLPVEIRLQDYRSLDQQFDAIVSVGMFEHVGHKKLLTFMKVVERCSETSGHVLAAYHREKPQPYGG